MKNRYLTSISTWVPAMIPVPDQRDRSGAAAAALPEQKQVCELILHLDSPFQAMAWLMVETALRMPDLQTLRVRDLDRSRRTLRIRGEGDGRELCLSAGLGEALVEHADRVLRPAFEHFKRWKDRPGEGRATMFQEQLLFPAWLLTGFEEAGMGEPIPSRVFVEVLQDVAGRIGFRGRIHSQSLRLWAAGWWLAAGVTVKALHERLAHRDLMTTLLLVQALQAGKLEFTGDPSASHAFPARAA